MDSATFWDKGTKIPSLSQDKGTTGQAKNLAMGRDGPGQAETAKIRDGPGRAGTAKIQNGTGRDSQNTGRGQNGLEQKRTF